MQPLKLQPIEDVEAEERVMSWLLIADSANDDGAKAWAEAAELTPAHFVNAECRAAFTCARQIRAQDGICDEWRVALAIGEPHGSRIINRLTSKYPTHIGFAPALRRVFDLYHRREMRRLGLVLSESAQAGDYNAMAEAAAKISSVRVGNSVGALAALLDARVFDFNIRPEKPEPILTIGDDRHVIATPGNIGVIAGQAKAGKSALVGAIIAAAIGGSGETLGVVGHNPDRKAVLHFDTEQSPFDHDALVRTALRRAQLQSGPNWLHSYRLCDIETSLRFALMDHAINHATKSHQGIALVIIDGIADFISDPNDSAEAFAAVERLHRCAVEHNTHILCVLHENPAAGQFAGKTRGHLGSQLERKAETNLVVEKGDDGTSQIYATKARHCYLPKDQGPHFCYDTERKMHVICGTTKSQTLYEIARDAARGANIGAEGATRVVWRDAIERMTGCTDRHARRQLSDMIHANVIRYSQNGHYCLNENDDY